MLDLLPCFKNQNQKGLLALFLLQTFFSSRQPSTLAAHNVSFHSCPRLKPRGWFPILSSTSQPAFVKVISCPSLLLNFKQDFIKVTGSLSLIHFPHMAACSHTVPSTSPLLILFCWFLLISPTSKPQRAPRSVFKFSFYLLSLSSFIHSSAFSKNLSAMQLKILSPASSPSSSLTHPF